MPPTGIGETLFTDGSVQASAVGEALVHGQIRSQHCSHHMVFLQIDDGLRFEGRVEISAQLKQPEVGRSTFSAKILHAFLSVPVAATLPLGSDASFDFQSVMMRPADSAHDVPVPGVAIQDVRSA